MCTTPSEIELRAHCRDRAFYAYGTARIFEQRAQSLKSGRNWITFLGIAGPLLVGGIVLSFGAKPQLLPFLLIPVGFVSIAQLILSAWSLVRSWDERHAYAIFAIQSNTRLYNQWDALAKRPPSNINEKVHALAAEDQRQEQSDLTQHITEKEKRYAMRASLHYFGLKCKSCGVKPLSLKPGSCDTCGNF